MPKDIWPYFGREVKFVVSISMHLVTGWLNTTFVDINSQEKNQS